MAYQFKSIVEKSSTNPSIQAKGIYLAGFEPATAEFVVQCSIQLSYKYKRFRANLDWHETWFQSNRLWT